MRGRPAQVGYAPTGRDQDPVITPCSSCSGAGAGSRPATAPFHRTVLAHPTDQTRLTGAGSAGRMGPSRRVCAGLHVFIKRNTPTRALRECRGITREMRVNTPTDTQYRPLPSSTTRVREPRRPPEPDRRRSPTPSPSPDKQRPGPAPSAASPVLPNQPAPAAATAITSHGHRALPQGPDPTAGSTNIRVSLTVTSLDQAA